MSLPDPTQQSAVLVTGASSGIGTALARELASRGHDVWLVARRAERLRELERELQREHGVATRSWTCDLADPEAREALLGEVLDQATHGTMVVGLCNNAGVGGFGRVEGRDPSDDQRMISLNIEATHALTAALLPGMLRLGAGSILNLGSILGFQPTPRTAVYAATKSFVHSFSQALHGELHGSGVSCTVVCPGPVRTDFTDAAGAPGLAEAGPDFAWTTAETVARVAVAAMEKGRRLVVPGALNRALAAGGRHLPAGALVTFSRRLNPMGFPD